MPFKSRAQENLFEGVAHGMKPRGKGPSVAAAKKFIADSPKPSKNLPEKVGKKK